MPPELVEIARFLSPDQASVARCALEAADIQTCLDGEAVASWLWHFSGATGGVKVLVKRDDAQRAREVLSSHTRFADDAATDETMVDAIEDEDEAEILGTRHPPELGRAWRASVIGIVLLPPLLNIYSMWLLLRHGLLIATETRESSWRAMAALITNMAVFCLVGLFVWYAFKPPSLPTGPGRTIEKRIDIPLVPYDVPTPQHLYPQGAANNEWPQSPASPDQPDG